MSEDKAIYNAQMQAAAINPALWMVLKPVLIAVLRALLAALEAWEPPKT